MRWYDQKRPVLRTFIRYAVAVGSVGVVTLLTALLQPIVDSYALFFAAVAFTTFVAGAGPGLLSVALCTIAIDHYFIAPNGPFALSAGGYLRLAVFTLLASLVSWLTSARKKAERSLEHLNTDLEARVLERTRELANSKKVLEEEVQERWSAQEQLREKAALLDLTHDAVIVRDLNDRILFWNRGAEETYGYAADQALGAISHVLLKTVFPAPFEHITAELLHTGRWTGELTHTRKDGLTTVAASRWALRTDTQNKAIGVLEINYDMTERKKTEEMLRHTQSELAHATRVMVMGELVSTITHEVNQPLCAIVTNGNACARWLRTPTPDLARAQEALQRIIRDSNRASNVIARIRAFVRKTDGHTETLSIRDLIEDVLLVLVDDAQRSRIRIETRFGADLPDVLGDRVQLQQVVLNLMMNAFDAMRATEAKSRSLCVQADVHDNGGVLVTLEDSGTGIPPENVGRIFEPFFTTKTAGLGMGLSICRTIIRNHGGEIQVTSNPGRGATFYFSLPGAAVESAPHLTSAQ
jgi:two-component system, LuxR family, sensor kinase FixL